MFNLSNKKAVITGATGGIGGAIFDKFYQAGAVVLATSTSQEKLDNLLSKYSDKSRVFGMVVNMTNRDEVEALCKNANDLMNGLDVVVCNAGIKKTVLQ